MPLAEGFLGSLPLGVRVDGHEALGVDGFPGKKRVEMPLHELRIGNSDAGVFGIGRAEGRLVAVSVQNLRRDSPLVLVNRHSSRWR